MKTVIMAGGKGTRIQSIAKDIPKPMIKIAGKPVLEHEIICLRDQGFKDIILTINHLGNIIQDYFKDGKWLGVNIDYYVEETPLGNAGALFKIKDKLSDDFLLLNADSIFDVDFNRFVSFHKEKKAQVTLFTHPNSHPYDSGLIFVDENKAVTKWLTKEDDRPKYYHNRVNAGLHVISKKVLDSVNVEGEKVDLDRAILKPLANTGKMFAYDSSEYVKDMGTPDRFYAVEKDFNSGIVSRRNRLHKQKAIFLDRDGTINEYRKFITDIDQFVLLDESVEAIKKINQSEYLAIVITNQPVIARGEVTLEYLDLIHQKMETELGKRGAYIDGLYFCPHHPDKGFEGERIEYKIDCSCRKPKPGLIFKACEDFNIDPKQSYMIGDSKIDVECGINAGCKTGFILGRECDLSPDISANNLLEIVDKII